MNNSIQKEFAKLIKKIPMGDDISCGNKKNATIRLIENMRDQILYYDCGKKEFNYYNAIQHRYYNDYDVEYRFRQIIASLGTYLDEPHGKLEQLLNHVTEKNHNDLYIIGVTPEKKIRYIKKYSDGLIKFYIEDSLNNIVCRSVFRINMPSAEVSINYDMLNRFFQKYNVFDNKLDDKHFVFFKKSFHKNSEMLDFLKGQSDLKEIDSFKLWLIFNTAEEYHLFSLIFKSEIAFHATFKDFRAQVVEPLLLKNLDEEKKLDIINRYNLEHSSNFEYSKKNYIIEV